MQGETLTLTTVKAIGKARRNPRGVFEKVPGSEAWWIRYHDAHGRLRREKAGTRGMAVKLYQKRKTEALTGPQAAGDDTPPGGAAW